MSSQTSLSISGLTLKGAVKETRSSVDSAPLFFTNLTVPTDLVEPYCYEKPYQIRPDGPPPRLSGTRRAPSAPVEIEISADRLLGLGVDGLVFSVVIHSHSEDASETPLPPLVIKLAAPNRNRWLAREAWFYDELATLQGSVVPQCYGWFAAVIPDGKCVVPWWKNGLGPEDGKSDDDVYDRDNPLADPDHKGAFRFYGAFNTAHKELLNRLRDAHCITLLLLERVGEHFIPKNAYATPQMAKQIKEDITDAYDALVRLGIDHNDIRSPNILCAPLSPPALPILESPYLQRKLRCRIVDFARSRKINMTLEEIRKGTGYAIDELPDLSASGVFVFLLQYDW
ncbi:hypothetical protein DFH11DRAFT_318001 [Phellopilus nigrolimitatus]|nr:hypothetical protein DFH11DRAFT_318001 [Phellopilus nigrolimitatus]